MDTQEYIMIDTKGKTMSMIRQNLLDIYHPAFREGYDKGRKSYFEESVNLTDKTLDRMGQARHDWREPCLPFSQQHLSRIRGVS